MATSCPSHQDNSHVLPVISRQKPKKQPQTWHYVFQLDRGRMKKPSKNGGSLVKISVELLKKSQVKHNISVDPTPSGSKYKSIVVSQGALAALATLGFEIEPPSGVLDYSTLQKTAFKYRPSGTCSTNG
jgi:hypothetical protein